MVTARDRGARMIAAEPVPETMGELPHERHVTMCWRSRMCVCWQRV